MNAYIFGSLVGIGVALDALTKWFATEYLQESFMLIPHFLSLQYYQNPGIAFSLPLTGLALKIITCILIFGIFWYYRKHERPKKNILLDSAYILIFAGALGNAWERIFQGYVTDMIAVEHFAVFNLADSSISIAACVLLWYYYTHS